MKKIFVYNDPQSCRRRSLDTKKIYNYLSKNNSTLVNKPDEADIIIFVTCAAVNQVSDSSLDQIKKFQRYDAELIVAGCLPEVEKESLSKIFNGKTISTKNLDEIDILFPENKIKFKNIEDVNLLYDNINLNFPESIFKKTLEEVRIINKSYLFLKTHILRNLFDERSFVYLAYTKNQFHIRVSWGCKGNCSYCTIKKSTGPMHSKPLNQCIDELKKGLRNGYTHFVITAEDIGSYGLDNNSSLPELLDKMTEIERNYKLYIRGLNPRWLIKYHGKLKPILERGKIIALEIPFQSGSCRILRLMHRYSDVEKLKETVKEIKKSFPEISLITHIIVGFPTETKNELNQTLFLLKGAGFNSGQIFPYSKKTGTDAALIKPQFSKKEILQSMKYTRCILVNNKYKVIYIAKINSFLFDKGI